MVQVIRKSDKAGWARLRKVSEELEGIELRTGWFETTRYEDGTPTAYVAAIHELGDPGSGIPPRPFMRPTIARKEDAWRAFILQEARKIYAGGGSVEELFEKLGLAVAGEIAKSISLVMAPPLKPATIAAKRRKLADRATTGALDKPLVETGLMISSVTHTVSKP